MSTAAHARDLPEQAHVVELNYGGDVKPVGYRAEETVQEVIQHGIRVFQLSAQVHQLGLFLEGAQLDPNQTLAAAGVKPGDRLVLRQTIVEGG